VYSVLEQAFTSADFEVIVVNDSGQSLPDMEWQHSGQVRVITTNRRERSVARNTGAAVARGKYLHFLDDDDLLLPGALDAFWQLDQKSGDDVIWLYGSYQTVDNDGNVVAEWHPGISGDIFALYVAGESIPFQASLLQAERFHTIGAFDPRPNILGVEDRDVGRRMALTGSIAYSPTVVAQIRIGELGSTTNWATIAESDRWGREKALSAQGAFTRLRASATSSYLHGRVSRAYFASTVWNVKRKNLLIAASRALAGLAFVDWHCLSPEFWRGLREKVK
jgi:glycosyltransferase involved in cell wall biosynthesis